MPKLRELRYFFWTLCLLWLGPIALAQDWTHLSAHLQWDTLQFAVSGRVQLSFQLEQSLEDSLRLHGSNLEISDARLDEVSVSWVMRQGELIIPLTHPLKKGSHQLTFNYRAQPQQGMYFAGWRDSSLCHPRQIYTHGQGNLHRHWIPLYDFPDDKYTWDLHMAFDSAYTVLASGQLVSAVPAEDSRIKTWHYRMDEPIPPYTAVIAIGVYEEHLLHQREGLDVVGYTYPGQAEFVRPTYGYSSEILPALEAEIGVKFPFQVYRQVPLSDYTYGGMENATTITLNDRYLVDSVSALDGDFSRVQIHEWAHQWFGTAITAQNDSHHWIQEGFATYFDHVIRGRLKGGEVEQALWADTRDRVLAALQRDTLPLASPVGSYERHYLQGALTVRMLRAYIGNSAFHKGLRNFVQGHMGGWATSSDVADAFESYTDRDVHLFFDQFVTNWTLPIVGFGILQTDTGLFLAGQCTSWGGITRDDYSFDVPIQVFYSPSKSVSLTLPIRNGIGLVRIPEMPAWFDVDPEVTQLMWTLSHLPDAMLRQQFLHSPNVQSALSAWRKINMEEPLISPESAFLERLMHHPSPVFREKVAQMMEEFPLNDADTILRAYLNDTHFRVVRAAAENMNFKPFDGPMLWSWLEDPNTPESLKLRAARALFHSANGSEEEVLDRWSTLHSSRPSELRLEFLKWSHAYPSTRRPRMQNFKEWVQYTSPAMPAHLRSEAISLLMRHEPWGLLTVPESNPHEVQEMMKTLHQNVQEATVNPNRTLRSVARKFQTQFPE